MAPSELAEIRALLIAQTETPEPRRAPGLLGIVGGLLKSRAEPPALTRPLSLAPPPRRFTERPAPDGEAEPDAAMLLLGEEIDPDLFMPLDLPPPPRCEFGVRSPRPYLPHDSVLLLNKVAPAQPRRLTLLTDAGEAVGELILTPDEPPLRAVYAAEPNEAPYFPGDLDEASRPETRCVPPPRQAPAAATTLTERRASSSRMRQIGTKAATPVRRPGLERDLLEALALTLAREHDALSDRLLTAKPVVSA